MERGPLSHFATLSAPADYFDGQTADRRIVTVRFGAESLTLYDDEGAPVVAWPLATIRRLPGAPSSRKELRLIPNFESVERLVLRDPPMIAAIEQVCTGLDKNRPPRRGMVRRLALWSAGAVASILLILFVLAPMLADTVADLIPPESEVAFGARIAQQIEAQGAPLAGIRPGGVCETEEGLAALAKMTARLENVADAHVPFTVKVLRGDLVNAFALPGGHMYFMQGLLENAASAEEVAGVLAHEIGHVVGRDPTRHVMRSFASGVVISTVLGDFMGGFLIIALANAAVDASYTREAESAADQTALSLLKSADLPAAPLAGFFARLREQYGDTDSYLSTHPTSASREQVFLSAADPAPGSFAPVLSDAEWAALRDICRS